MADGASLSFPMKRANPYDPPGLGPLRAEEPVVRMPMTTGKRHEIWLVSGYEEAKAVLRDTRFSSDCRLPGFPLVRDFSTLIRMDPPDHTYFRRMLAPRFVRQVRELRPAVAELTDRLIDEMLAAGPPVDLVEGLAMPLPSYVICEILGVPVDDHSFMQERTATALRKTSSDEEIEAAVTELGDYVRDLALRKREEPSDDMLSWLAVDQVAAGECSFEQGVDLARLLLVAGHVTTVNMIGLGVLTLLRHPDQAERLRAEPARIPAAVEELLRHLSVTGAVARVATEDLEVGGETIRAGEGLLVMLSVANRDPVAFAEPDAFDIARPARHHLAFGHGPHHCLGKALARMELEIVMGTVLRRLPTLRLAVPEEQVTFRDEMRIYGVNELPVTW